MYKMVWFYKSDQFSNGLVIKCQVFSKINHLTTGLVRYSDPHCFDNNGPCGNIGQNIMILTLLQKKKINFLPRMSFLSLK
jgi:hypothetical protein